MHFFLIASSLFSFLNAGSTEGIPFANVIEGLSFPINIPNYDQLYQTVGNNLYIIGYDTVLNCYSLVRTSIDSTLKFDTVSVSGKFVEAQFGFSGRIQTSNFCSGCRCRRGRKPWQRNTLHPSFG